MPGLVRPIHVFPQPKTWMPGTSPAMTIMKDRPMLDQPAQSRAKQQKAGPPLDFQEHLARLEAEGLLVRVERPINKDTELHPLVRWQFQGGLGEDERRAFLFTNVV